MAIAGPPGNQVILPGVIDPDTGLKCDYTATVTPIDDYRVRVQIGITWVDGTLAGKETLTTDIANEPVLN